MNPARERMLETRTVGGLQVSAVGLGTNNFGRNVDAGTTQRVVRSAIDAGITFIDTADKYGGTRSEEYLGRALAGRRDEVVLATKFGLPVDDDPEHRGASRRWMRQAIEDSLRRLRTDRIDLYLLHWPDPDTPVEETLGALAELRQEGKIGVAGCSNMSTQQLREAVAAAADDPDLEPFVCAQDEYSLLKRDVEDNGLLDLCAENGIGFTPYYPLAAGLLTGKYTPGQPPPDGTRFATVDRYEPMWTDRNLRVAEQLASFARSRGHTPVELAVSWLLSQPAVASVICGATKPEQAEANAAAGGWKLTGEELAEIDQLAAAP